jgi:rhamnogalacturonyl hydrolase YesR
MNSLNVFEWLLRSFKVCDYKGSAASQSVRRYFYRRSWAPAYPETTGYIIETLYAYQEYIMSNKNDVLIADYQKLISKYKPKSGKSIALESAGWICGLQFPNGALPGGKDRKSESAFNTGMMLFGLMQVYEREQNQTCFEVAQKATIWLSSIINEEGNFVSASYIDGYTPSYYTRILWGMVLVNQKLNDESVTKAIKRAFAFIQKRQLPNGAFQHWGFEAQKPAHTHTIAYTLRGFLESSQLLNDDSYLVCAQNLAFNLIGTYKKDDRRLAGSYDTDWRGDHTYICITGHAQISHCLSRLYEITQNVEYQTIAIEIFETIKDIPTRNGAIAGSVPFSGAYMPYHYPNWAAKFWLDAFMKYEIRSMNYEV